jgi:hypothetical protein
MIAGIGLAEGRSTKYCRAQYLLSRQSIVIPPGALYNPHCMMVRRLVGALSVFVLIGAAILAVSWWRSREPQPAGAHGKLLPEVAGSGLPLTEWFYADGILNPEDLPRAKRRPGIWAPSREWIVLLNLSDRVAAATATFYFENRPPRSVTRNLPAQASSYIVVHELADTIPPGELYGVRVRSDAPIIVQPTRGEYEPDNPVTKAMASFVAYPGPLGRRETKWAYADSLVLSSDSPLEEREWITVLNPNSGHDASVKVRFLLDGSVRTHELLVPSERVRTVDLFQLDAVPKNRLSGAVIDSDIPVVVEQVRRAYTRGIPVIASMWACLAHPIGDQETR